MPLKVRRRKASEVPPPAVHGRINKDLEQLKTELAKLSADMVLEVEVGSATAVRGTKNLITRASKQVGIVVRHWHDGTKVFAQPLSRTAAKRRTPAQPRAAAAKRAQPQPKAPARKRGRPRKSA